VKETTDARIDEQLVQFTLSMADDELILAHRNSEWTGHAPILEEDIAFSNIAQDELGHASLWYDLCCNLSDDDPDRLVFFRTPDEYRNVLMVELPKSDWAFTIARQYLFDAYELVSLNNLVNSTYRPIAEVAGKIRTEEIYHYRHTSSWIKRLGLGTEESNMRTQKALNELWSFAGQLFIDSPSIQMLADSGVAPRSEILRQEWEEIVVPFLQDSGFLIPSAEPVDAIRGDHTGNLTSLLAEMQEVARTDPSAKW